MLPDVKVSFGAVVLNAYDTIRIYELATGILDVSNTHGLAEYNLQHTSMQTNHGNLKSCNISSLLRQFLAV